MDESILRACLARSARILGMEGVDQEPSLQRTRRVLELRSLKTSRPQRKLGAVGVDGGASILRRSFGRASS